MLHIYSIIMKKLRVTMVRARRMTEGSVTIEI